MKLTLLILALSLSVFGYAENFVVISKADSGPGTLREALTKAAANGTGEHDIISFNLPGTADEDRTIYPLSTYTGVSSNLTIDASSQTGAVFPKSQAKVRLSLNTPQAAFFIFFKLSKVKQVNIYGLFLVNEVFTLFTPNAAASSGIELFQCSDIQIGKTGKGNFFHGLYQAVYSHGMISGEEADASLNIIFQSNVVGYNEKGQPSLFLKGNPVNGVHFAIQLINASNILIGGDNAGDKNYICADIDIRTSRNTGNGSVKIYNNNIGADMDGSIANVPQHNIIIKEFGFLITPDYIVDIRGNIIAGLVQLENLSGLFTIKANKIFGNDDFDTKISIYNCDGVIGGEDQADANEIFSIFSSCNPLLTDVWGGGLVASHSIYAKNKILILKNVMYNNMSYNSSIHRSSDIDPFVRIDRLTPILVQGKATPNSRIHVYLDDACTGCEGEVYLGETRSAADSNWQFSGNFTRNVVATATDSTGNTSEFTQPLINASDTRQVDPTCGKNNGSYSGIKVSGTFDAVEWHLLEIVGANIKDSIVSRDIDLKNAGPGRYYFIAKHGSTCISGAFIVVLKDISPSIDDTRAQIVHPSCGQANGSINYLPYSGGTTAKTYWINGSGNQFATTINYGGGGISSIENLSAGKYRMIMVDTLGGCADSTKWFELINQSGASLNMDAVKVTNTACNNDNGSITGIKAINVIGNPSFTWYDSSGKKVGDQADLQNIKAGRYYLRFKDAGGCDTIRTDVFIVEKVGQLSIDASNVSIAATACDQNTGSISNIKVSGAENYHWKRIGDGQTVSNQLALNAMPAGQYKLYINNNLGCADSSAAFSIGTHSAIPLTPKGMIVKDESCSTVNASVRIDSLSPGGIAQQYEWLNNSGQVVANSLSFSNVRAGTYFLYATDANGCRQQVIKQEIKNFEGPIIGENALAFDDTCETGSGSIDLVQVLGNGPFNYQWYSSAGNSFGGISTKSPALKSGAYWVIVTDKNGCADTSVTFQIRNKNIAPATPVYTDIEIARRTTALLEPTTHDARLSYLLYSDQSLNHLLQQSANGRFTIGPFSNDTAFYIRTKEGVCYSEPDKIQVKLLADAEITVANAFSPNGDGVNDIFIPLIDGFIANYRLRIFDRYGQAIVVLTNPQKGWDGKLNQVLAPAGVYYWIITGSTNNNKPVQQNGSVFLVR